MTERVLARHGLAAYAAHPLFGAVGIDRSYYAPVPTEQFSAWADVVPDGFVFLVKACAECIAPRLRDPAGGFAGRNPRFFDAGWTAEQVVGPFVEGLAGKAGPLVFQFAPMGTAVTADPDRFAERLYEFLAALPRGPLYAVELRDRALFSARYRAALRDAGAAHCFNVHPRMPTVGEQLDAAPPAAGETLVIRWMLHGSRVYEEARRRYEPFSRLVDEDPVNRNVLARACLKQATGGGRVVLVANNKAEGSAPLTLAKLAEEIAQGG